MEVDLSSPVLDVVAPRDGTPLSLSLPPSHMNSVTWADLQTEPGGRLGREVSVFSRDLCLSSTLWFSLPGLRVW